MTPPALELRQIEKHFGSVHALRGADFTLLQGELHALLGENGAGKTTLMHVAYGLVRPEGGEIRVNGAPVGIASPRVARQHGIGMVHQHFTAVPALSVAENVALAAGWPVAPAALDARVRELSERVGLRLEPQAIVGSLSVGLRQRLEIVKALAADTRTLLLDEPTAVLAPDEAEELLRVVRRFTAGGGAAVLITHKLDEALSVADRVTVLRKGSVVATGPATEFDEAGLAALMIGPGGVIPEDSAAPRDTPRPVTTATAVSVLVRIDSLEVPRDGGAGIAVCGVSLEVDGGEIVGVVALEGSGQRELLRAVAGRIRPLRGRLEVSGPVGFIPEDRTTEGLILELSLTENVVLGSSAGAPWLARRGIDWRIAREHTRGLLQDYGVVAPGPGVRAASLSGGNQQKVVVARELSRAPRVVVAEDPTRGLDIRAAAAIHARIRAAAAAGAAVLLHSSDLDEVLELADRVIVMSRGALIVPPAGASRAAIGEMMVTGGR
ncbi:MAG: ATP-binding cassette domain-containing protein [Gemmatimonadales bacterium]